jgi:hypothetical protein
VSDGAPHRLGRGEAAFPLHGQLPGQGPVGSSRPCRYAAQQIQTAI